MDGFHVRRVEPEAIVDLRHRILRPGRPRSTAVFSGDDLATTRHYAVFDRTPGTPPRSCATFLFTEWEGNPAWQLRGMATDTDFQGRGLGALLLGQGIAETRQQSGVGLFWCNARESALGFYRKQGWDVASEIYDVAGFGPHYKMVRNLPDSGSRPR